MNSRRIALLSVITSLCVSVQITPRPANVEFTSLICFMTGFFFGSKFGAFLGALTMFINGFLSPWGFAGIIMPFQMLGMTLMGFMGGIYRRSLGENPLMHWTSNLEVSILAAFLTLIYDVVTNVGYAVFFEKHMIAALVAGTWFIIVHVGSNIVLFGTTFFVLVKTVGENIWSYQRRV